MKKATENQGTTRTLAEYFSPKKVMSPVRQQLSQPHFTFPQETPMKPSQVPNLLPPPRRVLPFQTPYIPTSNDFPLNPKDRVGPQKHFTQPPGCVLNSPANTGTSAHMPQPTPTERLGPQQGTGQSGPRRICSSQLVPTSPSSNNVSFDRPSLSSVFNSPSPQSVKNINNHTPPSHSRSDKETESKVTSSISGNNNEKSQQHERVSSREIFITVDLNCTSLKRQGEFESCHENAKKPCLQDANPGSIQTTSLISCHSPSTPLATQPSLKNSLVFEMSPKTTNDLLHSELACGQLTSLALSSTLKPADSHTTPSSKDCPKNSPSTGAKQNYSVNIPGDLVKLSLSSRPSEESVKKENEKKHKSEKSSSSKLPQEDVGRPPHVGPAGHYSGHTSCSKPVLAKSQIRRNQIGEGSQLQDSISKPSSKYLGTQSGRTAERSKTSRVRRPVPDDIDQLFTPDPIVSPTCKMAKPKINEGTIKSPTSEKCPSPSHGCVPPVTTSSCHMTPHSKVTEPLQAVSSSAHNLPVSLPTVALKRVKLGKLHLCSKNKSLKHSPIPSSERQLKDETFKFHYRQSPSSSASMSSCALEIDTASNQTPSPNCTRSLLPERQPCEESKKEVIEEDLTDVELDLGLSIAYDIPVVETQSSDSSNEEELVSFQEMMTPVTKLPDTPEKGAFSEPSTPGHRSSKSKTQLLPSTTKRVVYKNSLDQMLKEINDNRRAKEIEAQLLTACKEDLLRLAEYEESEVNQEEVSSEQQEFLERYSLMSVAIREVPPGEMVFNLEKFGRIFDQHTLQLRQCKVNPQETAQKTLIWSSPSQLRLHVNIGLFQEVYSSSSPCPTQVTCFLFKMMSVHKERMVSEKILQALCDIASSAAYQIVNGGSQQFEVWVPSLADLTLVLMNMGVAFVTLFPFETLQPSFTEGDLLDDVYITSESHSSNGEEAIFPDHNLSNVLKYLSYCLGLCPRAYSDEELLLLLTVVGRISLETQWILQSRVEVCCVQYKIINNIRDWNTMLHRICSALTALTDDHHNMCLLVQLLPDSTRGKNLRQHLSMSMISKLLNGTYRPTSENFQLADLRLYLPQMQPSVLLQAMHQKDKGEDMIILDQQVYYLCYSLLTLTNEASNFHIFPRRQKAQLLALSCELETHIKCDIRESEKCLYRSKVKDLLARIYTKWQMLLRKIRPLNGKLYDYWQPGDTFRSNQEDEEEEEDETTLTNESHGTIDAEYKEEGDKKKMEETEEDRELNEMPEDDISDGTEKETSGTEEASEELAADLNQTMPVRQTSAADEQMDACITEQTDVKDETGTKCHI